MVCIRGRVFDHQLVQGSILTIYHDQWAIKFHLHKVVDLLQIFSCTSVGAVGNVSSSLLDTVKLLQ